MIASDFIETLRDSISGVEYVERFGGLTKLVNIDNKLIPVSVSVEPVDCSEVEHYRRLIPEAQYKSMVYFEEVSDAQFRANYTFTQTLRLVVWLNLPKCGFAAYTFQVLAPIFHFLKRSNSVEVSQGVFVSGVQDITVITADGATRLFERYKYDAETYALTRWPYGLYMAEFGISGNFDPRCLPVSAGGAEIICP